MRGNASRVRSFTKEREVEDTPEFERRRWYCPVDMTVVLACTVPDEGSHRHDECIVSC